MNQTVNFIRSEAGSNAVEYSIILGAISIIIAVAATSIGSTLAGVFAGASAAFGGS